MTRVTIERETLLPCPFCGDDGDKGRQEVTQMIEGRNKFARITCRACGAMCPEENWNRRAALAAQPAEPVGGYHFSETRPTGAVEKYPQTPLVTMEAARAYGAACAAEQRERDAQICDDMSVDGLPEVRPTDEHELACHIRQIVCGVACAAAIRASAMPSQAHGVVTGTARTAPPTARPT